MISKRRWSLILKRLSKKRLLTQLTKKVKQNLMWWENPSLLLFQKKTIDTVKKTDKSQASYKKVYTSKINKTDTVLK